VLYKWKNLAFSFNFSYVRLVDSLYQWLVPVCLLAERLLVLIAKDLPHMWKLVLQYIVWVTADGLQGVVLQLRRLARD